MNAWLKKILPKGKERRVYLDYAAATPVRAEVRAAMESYFAEQCGNPSSIHQEGRRARAAVEAARARIAALLRVRPEEITFTSGGTEANNLAILGVVSTHARLGDIHIISTAIEHSSVLETLAELQKDGTRVSFAPVDTGGLIILAEFEKLFSPETLLVTFAYVNSEIGVVQDVRRLVRVVRNYEREHGAQIFVHLDASQAPLWLPCAMDSLGVDMLTLDASKCYGPKGVGVLAHKRRVPLSAQTFGGGQEAGLRSGTENVPLVVGCAEALRLAQERYAPRAERVGARRDSFLTTLRAAIPGLLLNGSEINRVANNCNISIPSIDGEFAVVWLDQRGIAASTRSACDAGSASVSQVIATISGGDSARAHGSIRFTLGEATTDTDLTYTATVLAAHVAAVKS